MRFIFLIALFLPALFTNGQDRYVDSVVSIVNSTPSDTEKVNLYLRICKSIYYMQPNEASKIALKSLDLSKKINFIKGEANSYKWLANTYEELGKDSLALVNFSKAELIATKNGLEYVLGNIYNNYGTFYAKRGDYKTCLEYFIKALRIWEKNKWTTDISMQYGNIGTLYQIMGKYDEALLYSRKSLALSYSISDSSNIAANLNDIGLLYLNKNNIDSGIFYLNKAYNLSIRRKFNKVTANSIMNLSGAYEAKGDFKKALYYLRLAQATKSGYGKAMYLQDVSSLQAKLKNYDSAIYYARSSISEANKIGALFIVKEAYLNLATTYKFKKNVDSCYKYAMLHAALKDTLLNQEKQNVMAELSVKYETENKLLTIKNLELEKGYQDIQLNEEKMQKYTVIGALIIFIIISILIFNRFQVTKRQKTIIEIQKREVEHQKHLIEDKNKEIMDSISYAKRIQTAILPPNRLIKEYLPHSFILYKPKDIVAGDFYWMEPINDLILFAAADCTGHGVPGAMVSVICNNGLNRSVREFNLTDPGEILDKTRQIVIQEFEKSDEEVKDGMDISLCVYNTKSNQLKWSGANNPIWIIRSETLSIEEIKANKQPIGKFAEPKPFTTHQISLNKGDSIYIFTDGYQDQFGGDKGKKFKASKMKELLLTIQAESMEKQKEILDSTIESWKGEIEQVDDICILGLKVT